MTVESTPPQLPLEMRVSVLDVVPVAELGPGLVPELAEYRPRTFEILDAQGELLISDQPQAVGHFDADPDPSRFTSVLTPIGVATLYEQGVGHDERVFSGLEEERFPTNVYIVGNRNVDLYQIVSEVKAYMIAQGIQDASQLPYELKAEIIKRYVDFEIACKTAVSELGFDPAELRQRTLAYRAKKYDVVRMREIREEIGHQDMADGTLRTEDEIDAEVKKRVKAENAGTSRMDQTLQFDHIDVSDWVPQQILTAEWEHDFTNGRGLDFINGTDQMLSELNESQQEVLKFFAAYELGTEATGTLTEQERYEMAAEIDDVGVAGLSLLNHLGINVRAVFDERLAVRNQRYAGEIVHAYYEYYGDMRLALEACRQTESWITSDGRKIYQMNVFVHPALIGSIEEAEEADSKIRRYDPDVISGISEGSENDVVGENTDEDEIDESSGDRKRKPSGGGGGRFAGGKPTAPISVDDWRSFF